MDYADIVFNLESNKFSHNLENDFSCFAIWKEARPYRKLIRALFARRFQILLETEVHWSRENFADNANRLYEVPLAKKNQGEKGFSRHLKKIGDTKFILFILRDSKPNYTYAKSVSGKIELSNLNFVETKYEIRNWIKRDKGIKYAVHSTNSIWEFFFQAPLILGLDIFAQLMDGKEINLPKLKKDLEGSNGWKDYNELFKILNTTCNYMMLRGFEQLPLRNPEKDLDILTDNFQRFASAAGVVQNSERPYKGYVDVAGDQVSLDMRFVGDQYYHTAWAQNMLCTKVKLNDIYVPRKDCYFYSLFYHAKVQKPMVKPKYYGILESISRDLNFKWFSSAYLDDNEKSSRLLAGFLKSEGYIYVKPLDEGVHENLEVIKYLPKANITKEARFIKIKRYVSRKIPPRMKDILKKYLLNR